MSRYDWAPRHGPAASLLLGLGGVVLVLLLATVLALAIGLPVLWAFLRVFS